MQDCKNYENETERELDFKTLTVQHSGIYTCKILIHHEGKIYHSTSTIKLVVEEGKKAFYNFQACFLVLHTMDIFNYSSHLINTYKGDQIGESELFNNNFKN